MREYHDILIWAKDWWWFMSLLLDSHWNVFLCETDDDLIIHFFASLCKVWYQSNDSFFGNKANWMCFWTVTEIACSGKKAQKQIFYIIFENNIFESLWLLECGAVKQLEMASMLCAHCLPANRAFRTGNRAGARVHSFDCYGKEARQMAKFARCPFCKNNCKLL